MSWPLRIATLKKGVGANVWRFPDTNSPVRRAEGGYWLRAS